MTTLRNIRDLLTEAVHELWAAADFLIRKADDRFMLPKHEHDWIDVTTLKDTDVHEVCADCEAQRVVPR